MKSKLFTAWTGSKVTLTLPVTTTSCLSLVRASTAKSRICGVVGTTATVVMGPMRPLYASPLLVVRPFFSRKTWPVAPALRKSLRSMRAVYEAEQLLDELERASSPSRRRRGSSPAGGDGRRVNHVLGRANDALVIASDALWIASHVLGVASDAL